MNEQQRAEAAVQGSISQQVIIEGVASTSGESGHVLYTVRVSPKEDAPGVTMTPAPPSAPEQVRVLVEACRLLERREERAATPEDRQMLTQALTTVTRAIDARP